MNDSTSDYQINHGEVDSISDYQLNHGEVDFEFESNEVPEPLSVVDEKLVPKVGMTFKNLEDAAKFYNDYVKAADFSTRVWRTNKKGNEIKNQLITCSREGKWKSKISPTEKTNPTAGVNCPARIYIHTFKDVGAWIISKNNEEAGIRPSKTFQTFIAVARGHRELNFIEKDVRNYITREVRNVSEQEDAKEFGKYLLRMKEKNQNFFFELKLEDDQSIKLAFWADARSRAIFEYFGDVISFDTTYNTNRYNLVYRSFVGVNHHCQSILLGCILMKNEEIESFKWLFQCWLRCMGGNAPKGLSHRSMRVNEKGYRGLYANNNSLLVYLAHHEEDSKQQVAVRPSYMGSNLSGSPLLGRDEKHAKEREHAFIF
ncbi:hypothetical protein Ahy_A05g024235 [Arachis hypogaea]|uniref:MULE transposase domain-containing protein n=1 Tax=Arachis hypogaea TaxID=3818 RepID=A0A445D5D9_ARAHY|nr:hypothetical protein Ahy_A05g024235 [Arachis hypogaea]